MIRFKPGQEIKTFTIKRKETNKDAKGRLTYGEHTEIGTLKGAITSANQKEVNQWKQNGHPITHRIRVRGVSLVQAEDVLYYNDRKWYVQAVQNPSELGIYTVIWCDERFGV